MIKPNFIFIGGDRCGSKSMHRVLGAHPDCFVPNIPDPYFFDKKYHYGIDWYYGLFKKASNKEYTAIGEFSHDYIHSEEAAQRISKHLPDVKLIITLRHPVDRTISSYYSAFKAGVITEKFDSAIDNVPMLINNSLYADKMEYYLKYFKKEQIKVLIFDDLITDSRLFYEQLFDFLGLKVIGSIDYNVKVSALSEPRLPYLGYLSKQTAKILRKLGFIKFLGYLKNISLVRQIVYTPIKDSDKPDIDNKNKEKLKKIFKPQIVRLEKIINKDLNAWY